MRLIALLSVSLAAASASAQDASPRTGEVLATQCAAYAAAAQGSSAQAPREDPCRAYVMGFFRVVKQRQDAELTAMLQGQPVAAADRPCFAMPTDRTVSYPELAEKIAAHAAAHPEFGPQPAEALVEAALAANYPCPTPDAPR